MLRRRAVDEKRRRVLSKFAVEFEAAFFDSGRKFVVGVEFVRSGLAGGGDAYFFRSVEEDGVVEAVFEQGTAFGGNGLRHALFKLAEFLAEVFEGFLIACLLGSLDIFREGFGLAVDVWLVFCGDFGEGGGFDFVEFFGLLAGEFFEEKNATFHAGSAADEGVLVEADHGAEVGPVFSELAHVGEGRVVENALGKDDAHAPAGCEEIQAALDENQLGFHAFGSRKLEKVEDGLALVRLDPTDGFVIGLAVLTAVAGTGFSGDVVVTGEDDVVGGDAGPEGRIGGDDIEAAFENAVDVQEAVVVVDAAVPIAMHDHVHLAGASHAIVGIRAVDTEVGELPDAGVQFVLGEGVWVTIGLTKK